jgi:hypothetical protein
MQGTSESFISGDCPKGSRGLPGFLWIEPNFAQWHLLFWF